MAPENLPSVIKATYLPKPAPIRAEEGYNISGIPGAPAGPSYLITITSPFLISPLTIAKYASFSAL